jgi:hypothetical protein
VSTRAWPQVAVLLALAAVARATDHPIALTMTERYGAWRAAAAQALSARNDPDSTAAAAAFSYLARSARQHAELTPGHAAAIELASRASDQDPENAAIAWLRLQLCAATAGCDIRDPATTMRWVDADNGAAWLSSLGVAQREKNVVEVDRILGEMAQASRFDFYWNRVVVLLFDALKRVRSSLPSSYVPNDLARYNEATGVAAAEIVAPLTALQGACREGQLSERREACVKLARIMQRSDTVVAQLAGFSMEKHWLTPDSREARALAVRRRALEWRVASANRADEPLLPWLKSAYARRRIAAMRTLPREEDVDIAILREHHLPLEPPEEPR